jgi:predicted ATPase/class 3 adenylate cyclase
MLFAAYLPADRRQALVRDAPLPDRCHGAALFADISGFTPLTESLARTLGPREGAEVLTRQLNRVYDALIAEIDSAGGSVIGFAGDALTCWFDEYHERRAMSGEGHMIEPATEPPSSVLRPSSASLRAVACAFALQRAMRAFADVRLPGGIRAALALKVAVASGPARRFAVGDPAVQVLDTLAGATIVRLAEAEHLARAGDVVVDTATADQLGGALQVVEWREEAETGARFAVAGALDLEHTAASNGDMLDIGDLSQFLLLNAQYEKTRSWLLPAIYERLAAGMGEFLTELRPAVTLFLRFGGIAYEDDAAGAQLDAYMRWVQVVLARYDGTLLQLTIGDKGSYLCTAFGVPLAHEDLVRRAARAALDLRVPPPELAFVDSTQIGISQGTLRAGAYGGTTRRTYGLMGDEVNLAARLMQHAAPGEILVSGRVQAALAAERGVRRDDGFALEPLAPVRLKGLAEPLPIFRLTGARARSVRLSEPAYDLPMIGRTEELALISGKLGQALGGQGQVVGITAEAGLGKSRLVGEVIRLARRGGLRAFGGACQSYGLSTPYLVWGSIWRAFFDLDPEAPPRRQIRMLEGEIEDLAPERVAALPLLGPLLELPLAENDFTQALEPQFRKSALQALLLDCLRAAALEAAAAGSGLLLVLEDMHWIDAASHELLELVARSIADLPVLIVLAYRPPELQRLQAPRVEALPHFTRVELAALAAAESAQVIGAKLRQLLPDRVEAAPPALIARITERAQGNPFYIEELLNYLHHRGIDAWDLAALKTIDLPSSLHTLVLSRIDQLNERQKATLKVASVVGRLFQFAWLHGAYPELGKTEPLRAGLDELAVLDLTPLDTPEPELTYLFKHIVTQEVAYNSLTRRARARLHQQLAQYLEKLDAGHYLDLLAYHYDRSANLKKRREYLRRAGEAAAARYANVAALDYLNRALELTPEADAAERFGLLLVREQVENLQGARDAQAQDLAALEALADALGDDGYRAEVALRRANYAYRVGDSPAAIAAAALAVDLGQATGAHALAVGAYRQWAWALLRQGDYAAARAQATASLLLARSAGDRRGEGLVLGTLGAVAWYEGDYAAARAAYEQSLQLCREIGNRQGEGLVLGNLGLAASAQGDYAAARAAYEQSLRICREIGDRMGEGWALGVLGDAALSAGDYAAARAVYEQSLPIRREVGDRQGESWALGSLGLTIHSQGDHGAARTYGDQALQLARAIGERDWEAFALTVIGHTWLGDDRAIDAAAAYQEALGIRRALNQPNRAVESLAGLARVALAHGEITQAQAYVEEILVYLRGGSLDGAAEPLRIYLTCYEVLCAAHDPRVEAVLTAGYSLLQERAARINDEPTRRMFLEQVPYHRELLAAWAAERHPLARCNVT